MEVTSSQNFDGIPPLPYFWCCHAKSVAILIPISCWKSFFPPILCVCGISLCPQSSGRSIVGLMVTSSRMTQAARRASQDSGCGAPVPAAGPPLATPPLGTLLTRRWACLRLLRLPQLLSWVRERTRFCLCPLAGMGFSFIHKVMLKIL